MHNVHKFYVEKILRAKKEVQSTGQTSWHSQKAISTVKQKFFLTLTRFLFWRIEIFLHKIYARYACKKQPLGCKESLSSNQSIIRQVEIIIRHEKAIFVKFKEIISWQIQESISSVKKSFFQTSTRLLFWRVEFFLRIFYACYAYKKQSLGSKESPSINQSIARHVEMIIRQERVNLSKFRK